MGPASPAAIVGRARELSALEHSLTALVEGRGGIVWIEGPAGIGKSALVDAMADRTRALGGRTLRSAGDELMGGFPLRLMADCLEISARSRDTARLEIAALLRGDPVPGAADPVLAAAERMIDLVHRLCAEGPVLLVVEDVQWADEPSLRMWNRLARAVEQIPLLLVGVARPLPSRALTERMRGVVHERGGVALSLGPLSPSEVRELAWRVAGARPGPRLSAELARAGGNPLYVTELVGSLLGEQLVDVDGDVAEFHGDPGATPRSLTSAIGLRLDCLGEKTRMVLRLAALMGGAFEAAPLAVVASVPVAELAETVTEGIRHGVLVETAGRLDFRHALIQQVLVRQIPATIQGPLHHHIARTLADSGSGVDEVARHLLAADTDPGEWALDWLSGLDAAALVTAPHVAAELLRRALGSADAEDARRERLATLLIQVSFWLGRDDQVIEVGTRVAERASDPTLATRLWIHVLRAAGRSGRHELALAVVDRAAAAGPPPPWNARLTAWSAVLLTQLGRTDEGRAAGRRALADALRFGDPLAVAYGHHSVAYGADLETAVEHTAQAIAVLGTDPESMELRMVLTCNRLIWLAQLSRMDAYQAELPRALILAERMGTFRASGVLAAAAEVDYLLGDWDGVLVHLAGVDPEFAAHCGNVRLHGLAALIALHRGEREQARAHFAAIDQVAGAPYTQPGLQAAYLRTARALLAEADGDLDGALTFAASWIDVPPGVRRSERVDEAPHTVRLALAKGDLALARAATAAIRADALAEPLPGRVAAVRLCQAQLDDDLDALLAVAEVFRGYGWPLQAGHALEEAAVRAASRGDTTRARAVLTEAVRGYSAIGAAWDVRRADSRLRAFGVRRGPRSVHRRESCGWGALTPSELQIAQLVATGMSNPDIADELFLSRRTVQAHVSNILGKLGLTSRVEVGRIAADVADAADVVGAVTVGAGVGARVPRPRKR